MDFQKILADTIEAAKKGGAVSRSYFGSVLTAETKSSSVDVRTQADFGAEAAAISYLEEKYPEFNIFSEERGKINKGSQYTFVIDPLDGSHNFVIGIPDFSISIALFEDEKVVVGVVYQPIIDVVFSAARDAGAFRNGIRIEPRKQNTVKGSVLGYVCHYATPQELIISRFASFRRAGAKRSLDNWSCAYTYCLVAAGSVDAVVNEGNEVYDFAAGKLILQEAGGVWLTHGGEPASDYKDPNFIISGTKELGEELSRLISNL